MKNKANIKGVWTEFDYSIDSIHTAKDVILEELKVNGHNAVYLGSSKTVMRSNGKIEPLNRRFLFFNL